MRPPRNEPGGLPRHALTDIARNILCLSLTLPRALFPATRIQYLPNAILDIHVRNAAGQGLRQGSDASCCRDHGFPEKVACKLHPVFASILPAIRVALCRESIAHRGRDNRDRWPAAQALLGYGS